MGLGWSREDIVEPYDLSPGSPGSLKLDLPELDGDHPTEVEIEFEFAALCLELESRTNAVLEDIDEPRRSGRPEEMGTTGLPIPLFLSPP